MTDMTKLPPPSQFARFASRRSVVHSINGMVACSQPLAAGAGQRILKQGGNAADAAVAVAAALNMTEPCSTGIGGDMFCLFFDAKTRTVHALNGSGRSPLNTTLEQLRDELGLPAGAPAKIPFESVHSITVPGAAAGWVDTVEKFGSGKVTLEDILMPAIEMGEEGFPVSEISAAFWAASEQGLRDASPNYAEMLKQSENSVRAPRAGEIMHNPTLANTFRTLATEGKRGFYSGRIGKAIVDIIRSRGGHMTTQDLEHHMYLGTQETQPISLKYQGQGVGRPVELWEHPPNGQGIVALMALGIFEELEATGQIPRFAQQDHNSVPYLHAVIESLKIALSDARWWITDPEHSPVSPEHMISRDYLASRAALFNKERASIHSHGHPGPSPAHNHSDTVYFCVTDRHGNGMSFINSNYEGFGSCVIPRGCGFTLQNRGANFELGPDDHPNIYAGGKRPYHTIIPGLVTAGERDQRQLHAVYGVMGGFMQPQGHVQVLLNTEVFGLNPQEALDVPRFCIGAGMPGQGDVSSETIFLEDGMNPEVVEGLRELGHRVEILTGYRRSKFGRGQLIQRNIDEGTGKVVWSAGSDPRGDGCAMPA